MGVGLSLELSVIYMEQTQTDAHTPLGLVSNSDRKMHCYRKRVSLFENEKTLLCELLRIVRARP